MKESGVGFEYASGTKTAGSTGGYTDSVVLSHTHDFVGTSGTFDSAGAHTHTVKYATGGITTNSSYTAHSIETTSAATKTLAAPTAAQGLAHTHTVTPAGTIGDTGTTTNGNLPEYYVVNVWRRTN